jgi:hypothetical protein
MRMLGLVPLRFHFIHFVKECIKATEAFRITNHGRWNAEPIASTYFVLNLSMRHEELQSLVN